MTSALGALTPTRLVSHWADRGRREAPPLRLWLTLPLPSLCFTPCWTISGLPASAIGGSRSLIVSVDAKMEKREQSPLETAHLGLAKQRALLFLSSGASFQIVSSSRLLVNWLGGWLAVYLSQDFQFYWASVHHQHVSISLKAGAAAQRHPLHAVKANQRVHRKPNFLCRALWRANSYYWRTGSQFVFKHFTCRVSIFNRRTSLTCCYS